MGAAREGLSLDARGRVAALDDLATRPVDVLVIGGGITGCGVARDAALRGLRTGLLEQVDFGFGTSSRSSKIVHGGVRYLEQFQLGLVRESARERAVLHRLAPHIVRPIPFHYPVFRGESRWKIRMGLHLFDVLAGSRGAERSVFLGPRETRRALPGLRDPLVGSVRYPEYITDDARLTLENALSAAAHGARVANHARVVDLLEEGGRIVGATVEDLLTGSAYEIRAQVVVNATGPWSELFLRSCGSPPPHRLVLSKGIHILLPAERVPLEGATFLRSRRGRTGLAMRRGPWVYVGTSDEPFYGDLNRVRSRRSEVLEILEMTRDCFPDADLTEADVKATWAGLRPLVHQEGRSTREMSRADEVWTEPEGLVTVAGGKLTTYRKMAERILHAAGSALNGGLPPGGATARVPLIGSPSGAEAPQSAREEELDGLRAEGVAEATLERFTWLYGLQLSELRKMGREDPRWLEPLAAGVPALRGEVRMAVEQEMAVTLADFMDRRSSLLLFGPDHGLAGAGEASRIMAQLLGWSEERREREVDDYRGLAREHGFPSD